MSKEIKVSIQRTLNQKLSDSNNEILSTYSVPFNTSDYVDRIQISIH